MAEPRAANSPLVSSVLVCFAIAEEARFFAPRKRAASETRILLTGMGSKNAALSLEENLRARKPELVLSCGFAGGLNPKLAAGSIVFAADPEAALNLKLKELGATECTFHLADRIVTTAAEKSHLWETKRADAVEMESGIIRQICREHRIAGATIRVISDTAQEDLPLDFNELMTPGFELARGRLALKLMGSPSRLPALLGLWKRSRMAARALGACLSGLVASMRQQGTL
jgi:adenosylhomocysteine nucleosidase